MNAPSTVTPGLLVATADLEADGRTPIATLFGSDYSALALTPQRSCEAPAVVRAAIPRFAPFDARDGTDIGGPWCVEDLGDAGAVDAGTWEIAVERIGDLATQAFGRGRFVVSLGGDHSVLWPVFASLARHVQATSPDAARVGLLQLDVHHDVRALDDGVSNGTPVRGLLESGVLAPTDIVQVGIHPFANRRPLTEYCDAHGIQRRSLADVARAGAEATAREALAALADVDAIHLTVDIDVLDRAFAPGTAAALPGGLDPATLLRIVEVACEDPRVVAMDVVEFDPRRDVADITAYAAANVVVAALAAVVRRGG